MNHIYRLVWSVAQQRFVVASELARARGGASSVNKKVLAPAVTAALIGLLSFNNIALADSCTSANNLINSPVTDQCILNPGETLTVDSVGVLDYSGVDNNRSAVFVNFVADTNITITNNHQITGTNYGIYMSSATMGPIVNHGTITGTNNDAIAIWTSSSVSSITNTGTLTGLNSGLKVANSSSVLQVVNEGQITGFDGVLLSTGSISGGLNNSGIIQGGRYGVSAVWTSTISGGLTNSGTISGATGAIYAPAGSTIDEIIIASKTADVSSARFIGTVEATNTPMSIASGSTYTLRGDDDFGVSSFTNNGTARFDSAGGVTPSFDLSNVTSGIFTNNGVLAVAAETTGTITGNYMQNVAGTFRTHVTDNTTYGKLVVTGTATLPSNAKIDVNVADPNFSFTATEMQDIISAGSLVSDGTFQVTDNSTLFNFSAVKDGNTVDLNIEKGLSVVDANTSVGNSPGNGAAQVLDEIIADPTLSADPEWQTVITALGQLGTEQEVADAVSQTLPLLTGSATPALGNALSGTNRVVQARLDGNRGLSSGDLAMTDKHAWGKVYGSWHEQDDRKGVSGFDGDSQGLILGMDGDVNERTKLGLAVGYSRTSLDSNSRVAPNSADIDSYQLVGYGSYALEDASEISFQADYGWSNTEGKRTITFVSPTSVAQSDYDSDSFHVGVGWGKTLENTQVDQLAPSVKLDYTYIESDSYTETGAGVLNLSVASNDVEALIVSADLKASHQLDETTSLEGVVGVGYDLINDQAVISSSYVGGGSSFVVRGLDPDPLIGRLGFGLNKQLDSGAELNLRYDLEGREDYTNQTASVKLRWAF